MRRTPVVLVVLAAAAAGLSAGQQPPPPQPFPRSGGGPAAPPPPVAPAPRPSAPIPPISAPDAGERPGAPTDATLGVPGVIYPQGRFLEAFDLGRGQRCYLFGTNALYPDVVAYYKQALKDGGRELFKAPAMQQFDIAKFHDQTMAAQPSVVVKDYSFADGYLQVDGTKATRFKTLIQIVPPPGR